MYNSIVIGAGPGGYVAALRLAGQKQKVAIIESTYLGGTCLNTGCIPTKTMLHSSEIVANMKAGAEHGLTVKDWKFDLATLIKRKNGVVAKLRSGVAGLLKGRKVDVFSGKAKLIDANTVEVALNGGTTEQLKAENIIIASGSEPAVPGFFPQDRSKVMTSTEILDLETMPKSLLIVGGGVIGCEFATVFAELGCKVTIVEMLDRLLPMADKDISKAMTKHFKEQGVDLHIGVGVEKMELGGKGVQAKLQSGEKIETELALVCTGRRPVSAGIGLEAAGVKVNDKGFVEIDEFCCTNVPNIYAIGDVTGKWQLAHVASRQAAVAANNICGTEDSEDYAIVPSAVYTHPEVAWVGLTLEQAKAEGFDAREAKFQMAASGMAMAYDETDGFVKVVADDEDVILGAHLMCPHAADIVQEIAVLMKSECTLHELNATIHGHPTFCESLAEVSDALLGKPLHGH
ncbi:MAG: dihydrolipoyl dehydrogenase [Sedimentisphaerales bacterium]|nr:dihydrolipoyl dehydrogenase [Sedimentisphaerales bacterium]